MLTPLILVTALILVAPESDDDPEYILQIEEWGDSIEEEVEHNARAISPQPEPTHPAEPTGKLLHSTEIRVVPGRWFRVKIDRTIETREFSGILTPDQHGTTHSMLKFATRKQIDGREDAPDSGSTNTSSALSTSLALKVGERLVVGGLSSRSTNDDRPDRVTISEHSFWVTVNEAGINDFTVYPIRTELQQTLADGGSDHRDCVAILQINGDAAIEQSWQTHSQAIPIRTIRKALAPYADRDKRVVVSVNYLRGPAVQGNAEHDALESALQRIGPQVGFKSALVAPRDHRDCDWEKAQKQLAAKVAGRADEDELPAGNAQVSVYPVRTALSLLLTKNADCFVDILEPLATDGENELNPETRLAIRKYVFSAKLRDRKRLTFRVRGTEMKADRILSLRRELSDVANLLGFADFSIAF